MTIKIRTAFTLSLFVTSLAACADPRDDSASGTASTLTEPVAAAGPGAETIEPGPEAVAIAGITSARPCGAYTTARVNGASGETVTVCTMPSGHELIAISGDGEAPAPFAERPRCALDVFVARAAAGVPVPRTMVDTCARKTGTTPALAGRAVVDHAVFVDEAKLGAVAPKTVTITNGNAPSYCSSSGASNFQSGQCLSCSGYDADECAAVCVPQLWGTSQRTCGEGDVATETVASCGGSTRIRAYWREGSGDSWVTVHDDQILANRYQRISIIDGDAYADADMRFKAESASGAGHRHTFRCYDH